MKQRAMSLIAVVGICLGFVASAASLATAQDAPKEVAPHARMIGRLLPDPGPAIGAIQLDFAELNLNPARTVGVSYNEKRNEFYYRPVYALIPRKAPAVVFDGVSLPPVVQRVQLLGGALSEDLQLTFKLQVWSEEFSQKVREWLIADHRELWQEHSSEDKLKVRAWLLSKVAVICRRVGSTEVFGYGYSDSYDPTALPREIYFHLNIRRDALGQFIEAHNAGELQFQYLELSQLADTHEVKIKLNGELDLTAELAGILGQQPKAGDVLTQAQYEQLRLQLEARITQQISVSDPSLIPFALQETSRALLNGVLARLPGLDSGRLVAPAEQEVGMVKQREPGATTQSNTNGQFETQSKVTTRAVGAAVGPKGPSVSGDETETQEHKKGTTTENAATTSSVVPQSFVSYKILSLPATVRIADDKQIYVGAAYSYDQVISTPVSSLFTTDVLSTKVKYERSEQFHAGPFLGEYRFVLRDSPPLGWEWCEEAVLPDAVVIPAHLRGKKHPDARGMLLGLAGAKSEQEEVASISAPGKVVIPERTSSHVHELRGAFLVLKKDTFFTVNTPSTFSDRNKRPGCVSDTVFGTFCTEFSRDVHLPSGWVDGFAGINPDNFAIPGVLAPHQKLSPDTKDKLGGADVISPALDITLSSEANPPHLRMRCMIFTGK